MSELLIIFSLKFFFFLMSANVTKNQSVVFSHDRKRKVKRVCCSGISGGTEVGESRKRMRQDGNGGCSKQQQNQICVTTNPKNK